MNGTQGRANVVFRSLSSFLLRGFFVPGPLEALDNRYVSLASFRHAVIFMQESSAEDNTLAVPAVSRYPCSLPSKS